MTKHERLRCAGSGLPDYLATVKDFSQGNCLGQKWPLPLFPRLEETPKPKPPPKPSLTSVWRAVFLAIMLLFSGQGRPQRVAALRPALSGRLYEHCGGCLVGVHPPQAGG